MDVHETLRQLERCGVRLHVPKDRNVVLVAKLNKSRITPELAEAIGENKEHLMREVLYRQAVDYLEERYVPGTNLKVIHDARMVVRAKGMGLAPMDEYREAVREYVQEGLRAISEAKGAKLRYARQHHSKTVKRN